MDDQLKSKLLEPCKDLISKLVDGTLSSTPGHPYLGRLTADQVAKALKDYPGTLTPVPENGINAMEIFPVKLTILPRWLVHIDLWYDNNRSDLTVLLSAETQPNGTLRVSINDMRVM